MESLINRIQQQLNENHYVEKEDIQALVDALGSQTLCNTLRLLRNATYEANHYAEQIELLLKRKTKKKTSWQCKEEQKEKSPLWKKELP